MVIIKKAEIQMMVERNPCHTSGSSMDQPLLKIERREVVAIVKGRPLAMNLKDE